MVYVDVYANDCSMVYSFSISCFVVTVMLMINNNTITGDADAVCKSEQQLQFFVSDCGGTPPEITCECCSECCHDGEKCRDEDLLANYDPSWENGYRRDDFNFADDVTFSKVRDTDAGDS